MLEKDPKRFNKIRAHKNKNDEAAASNRADAEAGSDLEDDADDDDDEPEQIAPELTKPAAIKKVAPKKRAKNVKKPAAIKADSPPIQDGRTVKPRRPHRKKNWHYESAPSDSEWELKKQDKSDPYKNETIAKLRETVNRHARWCPFVQINKRLHHAHRRIRFLEGLPIPESEDSSDGEDNNTGNRNSKGSAIKVDNGESNGHVQREHINGNDEGLAEQPGVPDLIVEDKSTAPPRKKAASKAKVTPTKETAITTKVPTKPAHEDSPVDPNHEESPPRDTNPQNDHPLIEEELDDGAASDILSEEDSPVNHGVNENGVGDATAGAPNQSVPAGETAKSSDEASEKDSLTSGEELEAKGEAYLERHRSLAAVTNADAAKKRKLPETELTSDAEPVRKSRKNRVN
jgi:hypothetical protein